MCYEPKLIGEFLDFVGTDEQNSPQYDSFLMWCGMNLNTSVNLLNS